MNKMFKIFSNYRSIILAILLAILISALMLWVHEEFFAYYITAKFTDSGPLYKNMPVYYKGCRIGMIKTIRLSNDYKYSFAKIKLYPKEPKLSDNLVAKAKKLEQKDDYLDLIYTDPPSDTLLKNGGVIEGKGAFDIDLLLSDVADADILVPLLQHFSDLLVSADNTSNEIRSFFSDSRFILKDNKRNIKQTTTNLASSTKLIKNLTSKFNHSITDDKLNNTISSVDTSSANIMAATESIKNIAARLDCATRNLDRTVAKIDCMISEVNVIASNVKVITSSFCEVLGKRFAGLRIIFGKPIDSNKCQKKCSR